jgi:cytochrome c biogenesis protein CcdA/thiol-disulfide isomerase/thioredoxin
MTEPLLAPGLLGIAFVAGVLTVLGPCSLPIIPLIVGATGTGRAVRVVGVLLGFATAFLLTAVAIASVLAAIGLTTQPLRVVAAVVFIIAGGLLVWPRATSWLLRHVPRSDARATALGPRGDLVTGLAFGAGIGVLWAPCVGPLMAGVIAAAAVEGPTASGVAIAAAYVIGATVPLAALALGGRTLALALGGAARGLRLRQGYGLLMVIAGLLVISGLDLRLQAVAASSSAALSGTGPVAASAGPAGLSSGPELASSPAADGAGADPMLAPQVAVPLEDLGRAPEFRGITAWINSEPLTMASLRGKVVLVHFWTFACINCIHVQPYVKAWYEAYRDDGLVVVGIHTPELSFERDLGNVRQAVADDGVTFPVGFDPGFDTWHAYQNRFWPAFWFVDRQGTIRHVHYGEGDYANSEAVIRELLAGS